MKEITLKREFITHEGPVRVLKLREPIASDFITIKKLPFGARGQGDNMEFTIDFELAAKWLARLTGVDEILLGKMWHRDFIEACSQMNEYLVDVSDEPGN